MLQRWNREYESFLNSSFPENGKKILSDDQRETLCLKKQLKDHEIDRDILKKAVSNLLQDRQQKYQFIKANTGKYAVEKMCKVLKVSRSSYYIWLFSKPSK